MSEIVELRKILQDFIAPGVKALEVEVKALSTSVEERFTSAEKLAQARHEVMLAKLESMEKSLNLDKRLQRIEDREAASQQVA